MKNASIFDANGNFVFGKDHGVYRRLLDNEVGLKQLKVFDSKRRQEVAAQQDKLPWASEEWVDMWANYVIDNFDLSRPCGRLRSKWVKDNIDEAINSLAPTPVNPHWGR